MTVFQKYALFPHLNVFENIAFGLRMQKLPEAEIKQRVMEMLGGGRWAIRLPRMIAAIFCAVNRPKSLPTAPL